MENELVAKELLSIAQALSRDPVAYRFVLVALNGKGDELRLTNTDTSTEMLSMLEAAVFDERWRIRIEAETARLSGVLRDMLFAALPAQGPQQ